MSAANAYAAAEAGAAAGGSGDTAAAAAAVAPSYQLLGYEQQIVQEMLEQDALCIMAAGLGWQRVIAAMLQMHDSTANGEQLRACFCMEPDVHDNAQHLVAVVALL
jgi:ERCC4-related helicase